MSRGFPSMTALLGLLAIAGYQNRDKLAEMLGGAGPKGPGGAAPGQQGGQQGGLGGLLEQFKGAGVGGLLGGGLGADLSQKTGLSRDELLARLSRELPKAVDQYTPDGRLPVG
jgi:uncharacterized protein YidB (DUF937 family)